MKKIIEQNFDWVNYKEEDIKKFPAQVRELIKNYKQEVIKIDKQKLSFKNLIYIGELLNNKVYEKSAILWCFINLHTDEKLRNVCRDLEIEIGKIAREFSYNEEVYNIFLEYFNKNYKSEKKQKIITTEEIKIVDDLNKSYKKMGMQLDKKTKKVLLEKQNKIEKIASEYEKLTTENYNNGILFKKEELVGIPENIVINFKFDSKKQKYFVSIRPTEINYVGKYCEIESTRKKMSELSAFGVGDKNTKKLAEILKLRSEISKILGFKTFVDLGVSEEMMNKSGTIKIFLKDLIKKINPLFENEKEKDLQSLQDWQRKNLQDKKLVSKKLQSWNWAFANNLSKEIELGVTEEEFKPYFELENCLTVLFKIWEKIFQVKTEEIKGKIFFHESARLFLFKNSKTGEYLGNGVFDLFPRNGKYGHACMNNILQSRFIYLICNFMQDKNGKTLLSLNDVVTLFHEGGHFLHFLLMKTEYKSCTNLSNDFVEIPSQFHENFLFDVKFVKENFKHYETGNDMPKKLLIKIKEINSKGEGSAWIMQSVYALFDQELHGKNILTFATKFKNIDNLFENLYKKNIKIESVKNRHFASRFAHIVHGYESRYYSYVISRVYAQDFWQNFSKSGVKKGIMSEKYKKLLEASGTRDEKELVKEFLGRKVSLKPFLDFLGK